MVAVQIREQEVQIQYSEITSTGGGAGDNNWSGGGPLNQEQIRPTGGSGNFQQGNLGGDGNL